MNCPFPFLSILLVAHPCSINLLFPHCPHPSEGLMVLCSLTWKTLSTCSVGVTSSNDGSEYFPIISYMDVTIFNISCRWEVEGTKNVVWLDCYIDNFVSGICHIGLS